MLEDQGVWGLRQQVPVRVCVGVTLLYSWKKRDNRGLRAGSDERSDVAEAGNSCGWGV